MIEIRAARPDDRAALLRLMKSEHQTYFDEPLPEGAETKLLDDLLERKTCEIHLAVLNQTPVGFATFVILHASPNARGVLFLKDLYIDPEHRGQKHGRMMLAHLARVAVEEGCARFDWTTETDNPGAMRLYDSLGATRVEEKVYYRVTEHELDRFIQRCEQD